jgi:hypothetical protein
MTAKIEVLLAVVKASRSGIGSGLRGREIIRERKSLVKLEARWSY